MLSVTMGKQTSSKVSRSLGAACLTLAWAASSALAAGQNHALIVGVGQYSAASESTPLLGVPKDMEIARRMAGAMGVPSQNIIELRDSNATKPQILAALDQLKKRIGPGEKVFLYFSGHGTSYSTAQGCEQGFVPYTTGRHTFEDVITESELATYTSKIAEKADKAVVLIDACFSGGMGAARTRSLSASIGMRPKFTARSGDQCAVAVNQVSTTRSFAPAMQRLGVPEQNFVQISAARPNEVSWDNEQYGGLATHSLGQCLLGDAKDLNRSGSITLEEVRQCAQAKLDALMAPHRSAGMLPSTIQVRGSRNLIVVAEAPVSPPPVAVAPPVSVAPPVAVAPPVQPPRPPAQPLSEPPKPPPSQPLTPSPPSSPPVAVVLDRPPETAADQLLASRATLDDILAQKNGKLKLDVTAPKKLTINKDQFTFSVQSNTDGYLYAVMLGSDGKSFYLLYPNKLDQDNRIKANTRYKFPRPGWSITAGGPAGTDQILFVVSQSPRDASVFVPSQDGAGGGPFAFSVADLAARSRLVDFFVGRGVKGGNGRMAATLVTVEEVN
jgi:hypothetical protein